MILSFCEGDHSLESIVAALIAAFAGFVALHAQDKHYRENRNLTWIDLQIVELYSRLAHVYLRYSAEVQLCAVTIVEGERQRVESGKQEVVIPDYCLDEFQDAEEKYLLEMETIISQNFHLALPSTRKFYTRLTIESRLYKQFRDGKITREQLNDYKKSHDAYDRKVELNNFGNHVLHSETYLLNKRSGNRQRSTMAVKLKKVRFKLQYFRIVAHEYFSSKFRGSSRPSQQQ